MPTEAARQQRLELQALQCRVQILQERLSDALERLDALWVENLTLKRKLRGPDAS